MSFGGLYYPAYTQGIGSKPRFQSTHPFRNIVAAGTNMNNQWSGGSGHSGYGVEPSDYDYHSGPSAHVPSGGSYSYQSTTGTGYGPPPQPVHPPAKPSLFGGGGGGKKGGRKGSSAVSALTLLSFLFFINLLQGCIKDHMDAMNPTVMVMTTNIIRNRFNKMGDMNSREQNSPSYSASAPNIVVEPADLVAAAAAQSPAVMDATKTTVTLQSPYSVNVGRYNKPNEVPAQPQSAYNSPEPEVQINYGKPNYDPHQPDPYEYHKQQSQPQPSIIYTNHSLISHNPGYKGPQLEQHYNYHHTEYHAQPLPSSSMPQQRPTTTRHPHYEYQHPPSPNPFKEDNIPQYGSHEHENKYQHNYEKPSHHHHQSQTSPNSYPWSTHSSSSSSASVLSGPFRRASIISVSPTTKWISVPAKLSEHPSFEEDPEEIRHHDERGAYHRRLH